MKNQPHNPTLQDWEALLGTAIQEAQPIQSGRNSRVYRLATAPRQIWAGKHYFRTAADPRDRMRTEVTALEMFPRHGIGNVPKIRARDFNKGLLIMEFIEGTNRWQPDKKDIDRAVLFLTRLKAMAGENGLDIPPASEAFFSGQAIVRNIKSRLDTLLAVSKTTPLEEGLNGFLRSGIEPALREFSGAACALLKKHSLSFEDEIERRERTLSPSDFGFHNAIKRKEGELVFLDFEYFGWDDPAKTVCDFLLHPAMELGENLQGYFVDSMLNRLDETGALRRRVEACFPLFGLKWCLILLNEFLPADLARRRFAGESSTGPEEILQRQLHQSQKFLQTLPMRYKKLKEAIH